MFQYTRRYIGPIQLAIFDWAGTVVDYGCQAPVSAFVEGFRQMGVEVSMQVARGPMGMEKRDHIRAVAAVDEVAAAWKAKYGNPISEEDIDQMYNSFVDMLLGQIEAKSSLLPGVIEAMAALREQNIKIGASTGYFTEAMEVVAKRAAREGYVPDYTTCASDVPSGRPYPWMIYRVMEKLSVCPAASVVNVGDTPVDIESGLNAGVWTVGIAATGNQFGLTLEETKELSSKEYSLRLEAARTSLAKAGAHWVIDTMEELPGVIEKINTFLSEGKTP